MPLDEATSRSRGITRTRQAQSRCSYECAYSARVRTRFAPTPSGFLHIGNAAHLVVVQRLAQQFGAEVLLRIDDADEARMRPEYLEDIFDLLQWLELTWHLGPQSSADMADWSQGSRLSAYRQALDHLIGIGAAYACACPRSEWVDYHGPECPRGCRRRSPEPQVGETSWRLHLSDMVDPVIWRRDDVPAYHLSSVVDDDTWSIDLIVRGSDLQPATDIQRRLSELLEGSTFSEATVIHHDLITTDSGVKFSKSSGHQAHPIERSTANRELIFRYAQVLEVSAIADLPRSPGS